MRPPHSLYLLTGFILASCSSSSTESPADGGTLVADSETARPDASGSQFPDTGIGSFGRDASGDPSDSGASVMDAGRGSDAGTVIPPEGYALIPAGQFTMGAPETELGKKPQEGPIHSVTLSRDFFIKITEVTQSEWLSLMPMNPSRTSTCANCPVENVKRSEAIAYMNALSQSQNLSPCYSATGSFTGLDCDGYRFPTEAEWEYAARAGSDTAFASGNITQLGCAPVDPVLFEIGWYCGNAEPGTGAQAVGTRAANAWGLHDMHGNVREWVQDYFGPYGMTDLTDPLGPSSGDQFVVRGGAFWESAEDCRSASRLNVRGEQFSPTSAIGFRIARTAGP